MVLLPLCCILLRFPDLTALLGCAAMGDTNASVQASAQVEDLVPPTEWHPEFGRQVAAAITRLDKKHSALASLNTEVR